MPNPRLASRYAKSLIDLSVEKNALETVNKDVEFLLEVIGMSKEFRAVLTSPIIKPDKKIVILDAVTRGRIGELTNGFIKLLLKKSRENVLPEILSAFKTQYNIIKGINKVKLTTVSSLSDAQRKAVVSKLTAETGLNNILLETRVDETLIGGFVLEYDNKIVDASIRYDLNTIKKSFLRNDYIYNIR